MVTVFYLLFITVIQFQEKKPLNNESVNFKLNLYLHYFNISGHFTCKFGHSYIVLLSPPGQL
jgi:hypothetical protein